jgi:hypothetical protein
MTHVFTAATTASRRIALAALLSGLLSSIAFMATSPSAAQASGERWNAINGWNVSSSPFYYTREPPANLVRTKKEAGIIKLSLSDNVTGGLCVMVLRAANGSRLGLACWAPGEYGDKILAVNVPPQRFTVWAARRGTICTSDNAYWDGQLYY